MKKFSTFLVTLFVTFFLLCSLADAKGGGFGGRSSGGFSSGSRSISLGSSIRPSSSISVSSPKIAAAVRVCPSWNIAYDKAVPFF